MMWGSVLQILRLADSHVGPGHRNASRAHVKHSPYIPEQLSGMQTPLTMQGPRKLT